MDVPPTVLMEALKIIMTNNILQFGDTYWLQKGLTAMGLPIAHPCATISFGIQEEAVFAKFGDVILLYRHFINIVLRICLVDPNPSKDHHKWTEFTSLLQDYYRLELIFKEHSKTVNFMDMMISIRKDRIFTSLYEKKMKFYFYIPPNSANPQGVLTGLISCNIPNITLLCRDNDDINRYIKYVFARLLVWGYQSDWYILALTKGITGAHAFIKRDSV